MFDDQVIQDQVEETTQEEIIEESEDTGKQQPTQEQLNFKALREQKERAEREQERLRRDLDQASRYIQDMQQRQTLIAQQPKEEDDDIGVGSEDLVEGKHVKRLFKEIRELKKEQKNQYQRAQEEIADAKIKALYPDADKVLSGDNIDALNKRYPEIASTIRNSNTDMYSKMVSAYTMIKNFGLDQEQSYESVSAKEAIQKNMAKPRSIGSVSPQQSDSPLTRVNAFANGLTEDLKKNIWKEMQEHIKRK